MFLHVEHIFLTAVFVLLQAEADTIEGNCPTYSHRYRGPGDDFIGIFDDLTVDEILNVVQYMKSITWFNIRDSGDKFDANANVSYIYLIELRPPKKYETLLYLDERGPKPGRHAKVILHRGDIAEPAIEEYSVGPLPLPTYFSQIQRPAWRHPIPYSVRSPVADADTSAWQEFICRELTKISNILEAVTGHSFSPECSQNCLTYRITLPGRMVKGDRSVWIILERRYEGSSLHPVGLEFRVDISSTCPCHWHINVVWFRTLYFANMEELIDAYYGNSTVKDTLQMFSYGPSRSSPSEQEDGVNVVVSVKPNSTVDITSQKNEQVRRGPRCYVPDGPRFTVEGRQVRWMSWQFVFNIRTTTGPHLNDIRFNNRRIIYELSLQELLVLNSGSSPGATHSSLIQSVHLLGSRAYELYANIDCPQDGSVFVDFVHYVHRKPTVYRRAACLFEESRGAPLRRRRYRDRSGEKNERRRADGLANNCLILRTVLVTGHYEYVVDHVFHQNGVVETVCSVTGYVATHFYTGPEDRKFGFQVAPHSTATIHNHLANFKIDLDIDGTSNRVEVLDISVSNRDPVAGESDVYLRQFEHVERDTERSAVYKIRSIYHKYYLISNANSTNRYRNRKSYRINLITTSRLILPENLMDRAYSWAKYQIAVTKRKDNEDTSSTIYNAMDQVDPVLDFDKYLADDENITDEDLVAWVTVGAMTIPHSEDVPVVQTAGQQMSFVLLPFNYFDSDPSMTSVDSVFVSDVTGRLQYERSDDVKRRSSIECQHVLVRKSTASVPQLLNHFHLIFGSIFVNVVNIAYCLYGR